MFDYIIPISRDGVENQVCSNIMLEMNDTSYSIGRSTNSFVINGLYKKIKKCLSEQQQ